MKAILEEHAMCDECLSGQLKALKQRYPRNTVYNCPTCRALPVDYALLDRMATQADQ